MSKKEEERLRKQEEKRTKELERLKAMHVYEDKYAAASAICGIDEVGRGPLAGPVVAGAVILPKDETILYLNDSKKLSPKKREALYEEIMEKAVSTGIGIADHHRIDEINILNATYEAMTHQIIRRTAADPALLTRIHGFRGKSACLIFPVLDFTEYKILPVSGNEIDLPLPAPVMICHDFITEAGKNGPGKVLVRGSDTARILRFFHRNYTKWVIKVAR